MEMRVENNTLIKKQLRNGYVDNIQGYVFMAQQEDTELLVIENDVLNKCNAEDFWKTIKISVMDIEAENEKFKKCEYINETLTLEYDNRMIKIKTTK